MITCQCYCWQASLVAQMVKNPPAIQETWVQFLSWEDPWRRKWQSTPVSLPGEFQGQRSLVGYRPWDLLLSAKDQTFLKLQEQHAFLQAFNFNKG